MIKSGAVIQRRYLDNPYPSTYNSLGRPGNFDVARPYDSSKVFDTGMPKDVSPYQPRVAVSVVNVPGSVFKPGKRQRQLKEKNIAKWGQTVLKSIFGGEENVVTNYMAQRLLGLVGSEMSVPMSVDTSGNPLLQFRDPNQPSTGGSSTLRPQSSPSDASMPGARPGSSTGMSGVGDLFNLSLGEAPLRISIPPPSSGPASGMTGVGELFNPPTPTDPVVDESDVLEAVAEVETQPLQASELLDIVQETEAGPARVTPRRRRFEEVDAEPDMRRGGFGPRSDV